MARRADHTREELREMIIRTAQDIICEDGIDRLSARAIARRIGYTAGTLYQHFKDINEIVLHVHSRTLQGLVDAMVAADCEGEPGDQIHAYADIYLTYVDANPYAWNALFDYRRPEGADIPDWYVAHIQQLVGLVAACFEKLEKNAVAPPPVQAAQILWVSVHGVCSLEGTDRLKIVVDQDLYTLVHSLVDLHIRAYCGLPDSG